MSANNAYTPTVSSSSEAKDLGVARREMKKRFYPRLPLTGKLANRADATTDLTDEVGIGARQFRVS